MNRSDQQLSEGFESNQTTIEQAPHPASALSLRPTDFAPRALLRTHLHRKLPDEVDQPVLTCPQTDLPLHSPRCRRTDEPKRLRTPFEEYSCNGEAYRLVYSRQGGVDPFEREEDFTGRQLPLKHALRYQEQNYVLLRPHEPAAPPSLCSPSSPPALQFDSRFECGNLLCAYQCVGAPEEYHLFMENDTNRFGYTQWFYFSVEGARAEASYRFRIINFRKPHSFFRYGHQPLQFSLARHLRTGNGWARTATAVAYSPSSVCDVFEGKDYKLYTLSFELSFPYADDFATVSAGMPYSYSRLSKQMRELRGTAERHGVEWTQRTIAYTLSNNQVPYLIITKPEQDAHTSLSLKPKNKKKKRTSKGDGSKPIILVMARQHPGETHSSFIMESLLRQLANCGKDAAELLEQYQFHVFPMVNVDGVIYGNFRCDLAGFDLNRTWRTPVRELQPQVVGMREKIKELSEGRRVAFCLDLHSHSKQYGVFSYCCKEDEVQSRVFPLMLARTSPLFLFPSCTFGLSRDKAATARAAIYAMLKHANVLTVEASSFAAKVNGAVTVLQPTDFTEFAKSLLITLEQYLEGGQMKKESENEVKARLAEFQAYEKQNQEISGSDSEVEVNLSDHIKHLRDLLPEKTLKKMEGKCMEMEMPPKPQSKEPIIKLSIKSIVQHPEPIIEKIPKPQTKEKQRTFPNPKPESRKQEVLAILRTKEGLREQPVRRIEEQPIIRMPLSSYKANLVRSEHAHTKTENADEIEGLSEEESRLLQRPRPIKHRSSLILGSAHRQALKTQPKPEASRFKLKSYEEEEFLTFERVGDRRNMRRMSKIEKILRLRKRANTLKNIHCWERPPDEPDRTAPRRQPQLKLNKSSIAINRAPADPERERRKLVQAALTSHPLQPVHPATHPAHPATQTSLIGQLWRINYSRYSKELS